MAHPPEIRYQAVLLAQTKGTREAARQMKIPRRTIQDWLNMPEDPDIAQAMADAREELVAKARELAEKALDQGLAKIGEASAKDAAIIIEKSVNAMQLLSGGATARIESGKDKPKAGSGLDPSERDEVMALIKERRNRKLGLVN